MNNDKTLYISVERQKYVREKYLEILGEQYGDI